MPTKDFTEPGVTFARRVLGYRLWDARVDFNLNQTQVAGLARIKPPRLSDFLHGRSDPTPDEARRIAHILRSTVAELFPNLEAQR